MLEPSPHGYDVVHYPYFTDEEAKPGEVSILVKVVQPG